MNFADKLSDFEFVPTQGNLSDYVWPKANILRHAYGRNKVFGLDPESSKICSFLKFEMYPKGDEL